MSEIALLYSLARSGGTLLSKCLGCIPGNILLSEINPRWAYFNPLDQAKQWFSLVQDEDIKNLKSSGNYNYRSSIRLIHDRCEQRGLCLIIRDWTHVDYTPGYYPVSPVYRLSQLEALQEDYEVRHIALARHPIDTFLSLVRLSDYRGRIGIAQYLYGARAYAETAATVGFVRFEDFCTEPDVVLKKTCKTLGVKFDRSYRHSFHDYQAVTGDNYTPGQNTTLTGETVGERTSDIIRLPQRRSEFSGLLHQIKNSQDYRTIIDLLGYDH